jgi:hypothetical protein
LHSATNHQGLIARFALRKKRSQFVKAVGLAVQDIVEKNRDLDAARLFLAWDRFPSVMIRTPEAA